MKSIKQLVYYTGANLWVGSGRDGLDNIETSIDAEAAFALIQSNEHTTESKGEDQTIYVFQQDAVFAL